MNIKLRNGVKTVAFTVLITFICTSTISMINGLTAERVARNQDLQLKRAVRQAAGLDFLAEPALSEWFTAQVQDLQTVADESIFRVNNSGEEPVRLVLRQDGAGLWGTIEALVGFKTDGPRFAGFAALSHSETPGLGARLEEAWFHTQFAGKTGPLDKLQPEKSGSRGDHEMDAITGATVTSRAVLSLLNQSRARLLEVMQKGQILHE